MQFPQLQPSVASREVLSVFGGYNGNHRIGEGEFAAMENMSSDSFPLLAPRRPRGVYARPESAQGLIAKDGLCWVDGSRFVVNGLPVEMGLSRREEDCPKQLVGMGAYVVIFPDKKYINTLDLGEFGDLEAEYRTAETVTFTPAGADGSEQNPAYIQPEAPETPENMALWLDTSSQPPALMQWSAGSGMWIDAPASYVKISAPGIGAAFREEDAVTLAGMPEGIPGSSVIWLREDHWILVSGLLEREVTREGGISVSRSLPEMDFVTECGNRLWGCRYGVSREGEIVNEVYASKLGDFRNWSYFQGTAMDSYRVSLGADGPFTGAVQHMGYPLFFRENCLHKIYGSYPANFRLQTTPCRGVQRGCSGSLAIVGEVLYYKSPGGVCAYDGSLPAEVSQNLGQTAYGNAAAGSLGGKYYISMADAGGEYHLFVYDTVRNLWHREDNMQARTFCACREELYFLDGDGRICTVGGSGEGEDSFFWMAETGDLEAEKPDAKYLARLTLRLYLARDARLAVSVRYDEEENWHTVAELEGNGLGSVTLPMGVRRCDHLRLKLEGTGTVRLYSIAKIVEEGSDVF